MQTVIALKAVGTGILVEWRDTAGIHRSIVPQDAIIYGRADEAALAAGIPYGVPWEDVLEINVTAEAIAQALRQAGIWTLDDLRAHPREAVIALQRAYAVSLATLREAAETYESGGEQ